MQYSLAAFVAKWRARFVPNDEFKITASDLQQFTQDVADSFGAAGSPNDLPGFFKAYHCLTDAELDTPSGPGQSMESLNWATCNIYTRIFIERLVRVGKPTRYNVLLVVQYDPTASADHFVYIDGSHAPGSRLAPVRWVPEDEATPFSANVPLLDEARDYPAGYLVRYQFSSLDYLFYSAAGGVHPAPATAAGDANWTPVTHDAPAAILSTAYSLPLVQGLLRANPNAIKPGLLYRLGYGAWNGSTQAVVEVAGGASGFARLGTAVLADGTRLAVTVDVAAGTYAPVGGLQPTIDLTNDQAFAAAQAGALVAGQAYRLTADNGTQITTTAVSASAFSLVGVADVAMPGNVVLARGVRGQLVGQPGIGPQFFFQARPEDISYANLLAEYNDRGYMRRQAFELIDVPSRPGATLTVFFTTDDASGWGIDPTPYTDAAGTLFQSRWGYYDLPSDTFRYPASGGGSGTVKTVNGASPDAAGNVVVPERVQFKYLYDYAAGQTSAPEYRILEALAAGYYALERVESVNGGQLYYYQNDQQVFPDTQGRFTLALLDRFKIQATTAAGQPGYLILTQVV